MDPIKTYIQTTEKRVPFMDAVKLLRRQYGLNYFFRGFGTTLLRAFPVNAVCLVSFEGLVKVFDSM